MRIPVYPLVLALVCEAALAQTTPSVGSGAPTAAITQSFIQAYFRNGFNNLVISPPLGNVKSLGSQGLVQEFTDAANSASKYALVKPNISAPPLAGGADMVQMYPALYAYYTSVGPTTAGYPTTDTLNCPGLISISGNSCQYQLFDKPYALFSFKTALLAGANFAVADPVYTKWNAIGGISTAGPAVSASSSITSASANVATVQTFDQAMVFNVTSGTLTGRLIGVGPGVFSTYVANGGYTGFLGFPLTDEQLQPNGHKRQAFEGGTIDYDPSGVASPVVLYPILSIVTTPNGPLKLNLGDTATVTATALDPNGVALSGRTITWTTSNSRVLSLQASGPTVIIKAIAGGSATVIANGEGKVSAPLIVTVVAPCCGVGEGAPSAVIQQAFQDAAARNHLNIKLPAASPVTRSGSGYVQNLVDASSGVIYLLAIADQSSSAYLITGNLLAAYLNLGGPSGPLGYPVSDATAAGRQPFQNQSALAGNPVQVVSGSFLAKWSVMNFEAGSAGAPTSAQTAVLTFRATLGSTQNFASGLLAAAQSGPVYYVGGLIAAAYASAGGAAGTLGLPLNDQFVSGGRNRQDFEGGFVDYQTGDSAAQVHPGNRSPLITATPSTVLTGTRVRLAIGGFNAGATVRVTVAGQPDFTITTSTGAYVWDAAVSPTAKSGTVAIHAVDTATSSISADGNYTIRSPSELVLQVKKASGDGQTGSPGGLLPLPLDVLVTDSSANAVVGIPVQFSPSTGAQVLAASAVTDSSGHAKATLRLAPSEGIVLITATAGKQLVTFSAQSLHVSLASFPKMSQAVPPSTDVALGAGPQTVTQAGALLTSAAAVLRFYQNEAKLPAPNGLADPLLLNHFLQNFCTPDNTGAQICDGYLVPTDTQSQVVNLWRLASFVGGNLAVSVEQPDVASLRDLLGQGTPLLLALTLASNGTHYVVATGVNADGSIAIMDPNPAYGKVNLNDYLNGLATLSGAVRLLPQAPPARGFLISGSSFFQISSPVGACRTAIKLDQLLATFCDGTQNTYQLDSAAAAAFRLTLTDLAAPGSRSDLSGSGAAAFAIVHTGAQWTASPQSTSVSSGGVVNAASYTPAIAPQGLISIFGSGLSSVSGPTTVSINGVPATVVAQSAFQVSAALPAGVGPGSYPLTIVTPFDTVTQPVTLLPAAPAIFVVGAGLGATLNQDGKLNSPDNPANRGSVIVVYCTGLGATVRQGSVDVAVTPVTAVLNGTTLRPSFAGLAPGFAGLFQVNIPIPAGNAPGLSLELFLQQNSNASNRVQVAIQ